MKRFNKGRGRTLAGIAVTTALLVPLATFGAPAFAGSGSANDEYGSGSSQYQYGSGSAQYQYAVKVCHVTGSKKHPAHTITVSSAAVAAHLRHGDHLGACTGTETARNHGSTSGGNGSGHGHGHGHHP